MNPLTNMKNVIKLSENELKSNTKTSWHDMYKGSAWIFVGGFPYELTEGDLLCIFSQYGEIVNINLIRDKLSGKSKGYCFICYEDQRSTILSVDNLNGIKILNRTVRVDHVADYKIPKIDDTVDEETKKLRMEGCAPKPQIPIENIKKEKKSHNNGFVDDDELHLPERLPIGNIKNEPTLKRNKVKKEKKSKKKKKDKKLKKDKKEKKSKKKKNKKQSSSSSSIEDSESDNTELDSSTTTNKKNKKLSEIIRSTSTDNILNRIRCSRSKSRSLLNEQKSRRRSRSHNYQQSNKVIPSTSTDNQVNRKHYSRSRSQSRIREQQSRRRSRSHDYNQQNNKVIQYRSTDNQLNRKRYSRSRSQSRIREQQSRRRSRSHDYNHQSNKVIPSKSTDNDLNRKRYRRSGSGCRLYEEQSRHSSNNRDRHHQSRSKSRDYERKRRRSRS